MDLRGPHCPMLADILSQNLVFEPEMEFHYAIDLGQNSCVNSPQFLAGSKCVQKIHNYSNTYCKHTAGDTWFPPTDDLSNKTQASRIRDSVSILLVQLGQTPHAQLLLISFRDP